MALAWPLLLFEMAVDTSQTRSYLPAKTLM